MIETVQQAYEQQVAWFTEHPEYGFDLKAQKCKYRTPDGKKCAVGCLIPDDKYDLWFDEYAIDLARVINVVFEKPSYEVTDYLMESQRLHDEYAVDGEPIEEFLSKLEKLAQKYI